MCLPPILVGAASFQAQPWNFLYILPTCLSCSKITGPCKAIRDGGTGSGDGGTGSGDGGAGSGEETVETAEPMVEATERESQRYRSVTSPMHAIDR